MRHVDDAALIELRQLVGQHGVIVVPGQQLTTDDEIRFASKWGVPIARPGRSALLALDSTERPGSRPQGGGWHSDMSWASVTPYATLLYGVTIPDVGGDTIIANECAAYDSLPEQLRERIAGLTAEHRHPNPPGKFAAGATSHPVVRVIPESGRRALFVNPAFTQQILGVNADEGRRLLWRLYRYATRPEVTYRHHWVPGDLLVWDNRCVLHYAIHDHSEPRLLHRITVQDPSPAA